jgi:predicted DsbA family dithiol-disulfide isomerase
MGKFQQALDSHKHKDKIQKDSDIAKQAGINGTPSFVINGYFVNGAQDASAFKKVISLAMKK